MSGETIFNMVRKLLRDYEATHSGNKPSAIYVRWDWIRPLKHYLSGGVTGVVCEWRGAFTIDGVGVWKTDREGIHVY